MKYLKSYNESLSEQDITDLLTLNLEDNDKFDVRNIKFGSVQNWHDEKWMKVSIHENWINNTEIVDLYKDAIDKNKKLEYGADAVETKNKNLDVIRQRVVDINEAMLTKIGRKYDFRISTPQLTVEEYTADKELFYVVTFILKSAI